MKNNKKYYRDWLKIKKNNKKLSFINWLKKKNKKLFLTNYLYSNKKLKKGIFLKSPNFNEIKYPIKFNFKLINEFLRKK